VHLNSTDSSFGLGRCDPPDHLREHLVLDGGADAEFVCERGGMVKAGTHRDVPQWDLILRIEAITNRTV
jgi:hypothetical protein